MDMSSAFHQSIYRIGRADDFALDQLPPNFCNRLKAYIHKTVKLR